MENSNVKMTVKPISKPKSILSLFAKICGGLLIGFVMLIILSALTQALFSEKMNDKEKLAKTYEVLCNEAKALLYHEITLEGLKETPDNAKIEYNNKLVQEECDMILSDLFIGVQK